jgi:molybdate transport system regulatory protein
MVRLTIRIDFSPTSSVGPGKIRLLELIAETGSISAAGRAMGMSYRRAWLLVDELNRLFKHKVATTTLGGKSGGGAALTAFGRSLVAEYRAIECQAHDRFAKRLSTLGAASAKPRRRPRRRGKG